MKRPPEVADLAARAAARPQPIKLEIAPNHLNGIVLLSQRLGMSPSQVLNLQLDIASMFVSITALAGPIAAAMRGLQAMAKEAAEQGQAEQKKAEEDAKDTASAARCESCRGLGTIKADDAFVDCPTCGGKTDPAAPELTPSEKTAADERLVTIVALQMAAVVGVDYEKLRITKGTDADQFVTATAEDGRRWRVSLRDQEVEFLGHAENAGEPAAGGAVPEGSAKADA